MKQKMYRSLILVSVLALSACAGKNPISTGSPYEPGPVDVGPSIEELKKSPCACMEIPMIYPDGYGVVGDLDMYGA